MTERQAPIDDFAADPSRGWRMEESMSTPPPDASAVGDSGLGEELLAEWEADIPGDAGAGLTRARLRRAIAEIRRLRVALAPEEPRPCADAKWGGRGEWACLTHHTGDPAKGCPGAPEASR